MTDKFFSDVRSKIMSRIRSKWTMPEKKLHNLMKGNKIRHLMHPNLLGNPDVFLKDYNAVLFIDGCFWHNCPKHGHIPESNKDYWSSKIQRNVTRDKKASKVLKDTGFLVIRFWECMVMKKDFKGKDILRNIKYIKNKNTMTKRR